ncbi:MAG: hypothetical protein V7637_821 [Mycobacteriales bacterium]
MFITGQPADLTGSPDAGPVRLGRAGRRVFTEASDLALDPQLRVFIGDMVRPYGVPLREDLLAAGAGQSYGQMAEALLRDTLPADEPIDLLVLAFAIHDIRIGQATAVYLSSRCPGTPHAFAVCDQGAAAAFTGLRLVDAYARTGACRRALLIVAEQSALHYQPAPGPVAPIPDVHATVALLFDAGAAPAAAGAAPGGARPVDPDATGLAITGVAQYADVGPAELSGRLAAALDAVAADPAEVVVIVGPGLADAAGELPGKVVTAPAGQPYTGVWWELAGGATEWARGGRPVLLADYDPALRYLCLSTFDSSAGGAGAAAAGLLRPGQPVR